MGFTRAEAAEMREAAVRLRQTEQIDKMRGQAAEFLKQTAQEVSRASRREDSIEEENVPETDPTVSDRRTGIQAYFVDEMTRQIVVDETPRDLDEEDEDDYLREPSLVQTDFQRQYLQALEAHYRRGLEKDAVGDPDTGEDSGYDDYADWR